ncbi:MAG: helix-turn-helix domain-containing protein [Clostridia bacterium]|nr:helix-turn-helix domain-containing protein [Clostridia bacterium]
MNDYDFGNRVYELRSEAKLSQKELAELLGVTDKAVSKWENGRAKPTTDALRKLSGIFGVSVEELLQLRKAEPEPRVVKIAITGGSRDDRSAAISRIRGAFEDRGWQVLFVPETAEELAAAGISPQNCGGFLRCHLLLQLQREALFTEAAKQMNADRVLIVCNGGAPDVGAFAAPAEFAQLLRDLGKSGVELRDSYDAVFCLMPCAGYEDSAHGCAGGPKASEGGKIIAAWTGHGHLRMIGAPDREDGMKRLMRETAAFLGEPEPLEIEKKYLIEYPDLRRLEQMSNCRRSEIIQTYLKALEGWERRVRQRGEDGNYTFFETTKRPVSDLKRMEIERRISRDEYLQLLMEADPGRRAIRKTRYCLTENGRCFEIDLYPFWNDRAIVEVELADEEETVRLPGMLRVIREVTSDENYRNAALAAIGQGGLSCL